jgi:hypothetical protein
MFLRRIPRDFHPDCKGRYADKTTAHPQVFESVSKNIQKRGDFFASAVL